VFFEGPVTVVASDGTAVTREKGAFCRCGASANKPFCDGAHRGIGFEAP
jgi:CDGSH-type Zn-finger protein